MPTPTPQMFEGYNICKSVHFHKNRHTTRTVAPRLLGGRLFLNFARTTPLFPWLLVTFPQMTRILLPLIARWACRQYTPGRYSIPCRRRQCVFQGRIQHLECCRNLQSWWVRCWVLSFSFPVWTRRVFHARRVYNVSLRPGLLLPVLSLWHCCVEEEGRSLVVGGWRAGDLVVVVVVMMFRLWLCVTALCQDPAID